MANNNNITIQGNLCADCEIFKNRVVKMRVAVNKGKDKGPLYVSVALFTDNEDMLDKCFQDLIKGARVEVNGTLDIQTYTAQDETVKTDVAIIADEIKVIKYTYIPLKKKDNNPDTTRKRTRLKEDNNDDGDCPF